MPYKNGSGIIKFGAWSYQNKMIKYNMAYINKMIFPYDNGRVIGYDNAHNFHHKHYFGEIIDIDDFVNYQKLVLRFQNDLKEFIQ